MDCSFAAREIAGAASSIPTSFMLSGAGLYVIAGDEDRTFGDVLEALACLKRNRAVE